MCQFNADQYSDEDEVLDQVLRPEREAKQRRRQNNANPSPWCKSNKTCFRKVY